MEGGPNIEAVEADVVVPKGPDEDVPKAELNEEADEAPNPEEPNECVFEVNGLEDVVLEKGFPVLWPKGLGCVAELKLIPLAG